MAGSRDVSWPKLAVVTVAGVLALVLIFAALVHDPGPEGEPVVIEEPCDEQTTRQRFEDNVIVEVGPAWWYWPGSR